MTRSGHLALLEVRRYSQMSRSGWRPFWMSGSGWLALPEVLNWSGGPPRCPGMVGRPSRMSDSVREAIPNVREW